MSEAVETSTIMDCKHMEKIIDDFIDVHKSSPEQYTNEWFNLVKNTFGGSEIASLLGKNYYSSFYDTIKKKLQNIEMRSNDACNWGHLFEDVAADYVELDLCTKIKGRNMCIYHGNSIRFSPDGYAVISSKNASFLPNEWQNVLIEFKCPLTRQIKNNPPDYYIPQVLMGISLSPVDCGLLIESEFKLCSIEDFKYPQSYNTSFHTSNLSNSTLEPVVCGIIGIYQNSNKISTQFIDFGKVSNKKFSQTLEYIRTKKLFSTKSFICSAIDVLETIKKLKSSYNGFIGVIPWKLFKIAYHPIYKRTNYLDDVVIPAVNTAVDVINQAKKSDNPIDYITSISGDDTKISIDDIIV